MPHPFPGMNPWLEDPALWRDVHHSLINALRDTLAPLLRPRYFVAVETHTYITTTPQPPQSSRFPDLMVINRGGPAVAAPAAELTPYINVNLPIAEPAEQGYLEVRLVPSGEVVTIIELLSHANKQSDREAYLKKRKEIIDSHVHFVELDLLRAGTPLPYTEKANGHHYRFFIRRSERPLQARLYPFDVQQPFPSFTLPLRPDDVEPVVDLGPILQGVYDRAGYDLILRYDELPDPPLSPDDAAWAKGLLEKQA